MIKSLSQKPIPVYWWRYQYPSKLNFGDEITPYLIKRIFNLPVGWSPISRSHLIGTGSILEHCSRKSTRMNHKISVWGSGFIEEVDDNSFDINKFDFYAVRGVLSAQRIGKPCIAVGDPGLLMSYAFPEFLTSDKPYRVGVIPHYVDIDSPELSQYRSAPDILIINPLDSPLSVAAKINQCKIILSSSLHGLIFADSYGIPSYWTPLSNNLTGGAFKFHDYYSVYQERAVPSDLHQQIKQWEELYASFIPRGIARLQNQLIESFPFTNSPQSYFADSGSRQCLKQEG